MARVFLGLGSNTGWRLRNLREGIRALAGAGSVRSVSSVIESPPLGSMPQGPFLNVVLEMTTDLSPERLLRAVRRIERQVGRIPTCHWGPRTLDIDILIYDDVDLARPNLVLPHPRISERPFVLEPLREIAPEVALRWNGSG